MEKKNNKKLLLIIIPVVIILALVAIFYLAKPGTNKGAKSITITVVDNSGASTEYKLNTDAEYLRQAMEETEELTFSGDESEFGMMVTEINGLVADYNVDGSYWAFYVNGDYCQYGIDTQPVADQDAFSIEYTAAQ